MRDLETFVNVISAIEEKGAIAIVTIEEPLRSNQDDTINDIAFAYVLSIEK